MAKMRLKSLWNLAEIKKIINSKPQYGLKIN
jgi:hypothetical protein